MHQQPNILVVGTGSIGGVCAARLAKAGYAVEVVCKDPDLVPKIKTEGLKISGISGNLQVPMSAVATIPELSEQKDIVLLATKATDMMEAASALLPFLHEKSLVVSLQNGICEEMLAVVLGRDRVVGCVVGWGATMLGPGELEMTSEGEFIIGRIDPAITQEQLQLVQKILSKVVPVEISEDIIANLYSKLIINSCITSLGAICGLYLGEMLRKKKIRTVFIEIMREAMAVADAMQMKVPPYANKIDYYKFLGNKGWWGNFRRHLIIRIIGSKYRRLKSSSLQSLERGKATEIDYLNGYIVQKGAELGIPTPINSLVVETIKEIEIGQRKISEQNFAEKGFW
jgi:2-dehydropantoate 2-reductase